MLEQVLQEIHNWFQVEIIPGAYRVEEGRLELPFLREGQYYRIVGSVFNDGLHQYGQQDSGLKDEQFEGAIWPLAIPKAVASLAEEIAAWQAKYGEAAASPYTSESFGGYSYTKAGRGESTSANDGWQAVFRARLNPWRKLREM